MNERLTETDVLVVGGGIAGCFAAIKAKENGVNVTLVDKAYAGSSGASSGVAASLFVFNPEWGLDFDAVIKAITIHGEYINNREWGKIIVEESLAAYREMRSWSVEFPQGHDRKPTVYAPFGGVFVRFRKIPLDLRRQAERVGVKIIDRIMVTDIIKQKGSVVGAVGFSLDDGNFYVFKAKATVLAAGGNSFKPSGQPIHMLTGDAEAIAYRLGLEISGKEFPATHPTLAMHPAVFFPYTKRDVGLVPFLPHYTDGEGNKHSAWSIAGMEGSCEPGISLEFAIHAGKGPLYWDFDTAPSEVVEASRLYHQMTFGAEREYKTSGKYQMAGGAAAGYNNVGCGGVCIANTKCATALPGLFVAGDCCATRLNGSYIAHPGLGSCHAAVTGRRAGIGAAEYVSQVEEPELNWEEVKRLKEKAYAPLHRKSGFSPRWVTLQLQNIMIPYYIIFIKHEKRLQAALTLVEFLRDHFVPKLYARDPHELRLAHETENMVLNAEMILRASLFRAESRGTHYREDYPRRRDPEWLAWTKIKDEQGQMKLYKEPIPREWWPDLSKPYEERYPCKVSRRIVLG